MQLSRGGIVEKRMKRGFLAVSADLRSTLFQGMTGIHRGAAVRKSSSEAASCRWFVEFNVNLLKGKANGPQGNEEEDGEKSAGS